MAAIFSLIGLLGVLAGAAATAAGLYETFGETQKAVDAWVSGAQVFFSGAMLMALGSVAARVRGTTKAVEDLGKAVRALRGELSGNGAGNGAGAGTKAGSAARREHADESFAAAPARAARGGEVDSDDREPVLERRGARDGGDDRPGGTSTRRTRLGPALGDDRDFEPAAARRSGGRMRRGLDED